MILRVRRKTVFENRYHKNMGRLKGKVTRIQLCLFGVIPVKTIHEYRETYYGEVKDVEICNLSK